MKKSKKIGLWILTIVLALIVPGIFPSFSCIFAALLTAIALPIEPWQDFISKYIQKKWKTPVIILLTVLMLVTFPVSNSAETADIPGETTVATTLPTESIVETTEVTSAPTVEVTISTADPATPVVESIAPTTQPTTVPTTVPTTPPTTEVTTPVHTHSFSAATCTMPKACSCGATEGDAIGHAWIAATCTAAQTCSTCGETSGSATGHSYNSGSCSSCGTADPNFVRETLVWIPTHGGTKYHSKASCSQMVDPLQVTKSEAINQGFGPCGRCY